MYFIFAYKNLCSAYLVFFVQQILGHCICNISLYDTCRSCILGQLKHTDDTEQDLTAEHLEAYGVILSIGSSRPSKVSVLASEIMSTLPRSVAGALEQWNTDSKNNFPSPGAWVGILSFFSLFSISFTI